MAVAPGYGFAKIPIVYYLGKNLNFSNSNFIFRKRAGGTGASETPGRRDSSWEMNSWLSPPLWAPSTVAEVNKYFQ